MLLLADARLAAAVSNAGALGTLSPYAGMKDHGDPVENLGMQIACARQWTQNPFAVNIPLDLPESGLLVDLTIREQVPVVVTAAGSPEIYSELFLSAGIRVLHVTSSVSQAAAAEVSGVDAVIAEGCEAGGRIGRDEIPLVSLVPQVVEAVSIPVIAAGGIADGHSMASALALGASAVQMGTRFIAVEECPAHPAYKSAIVASGDAATLVTRRHSVPMRCLRSAFVMKLSAMERTGVTVDRIDQFIGRGRARAAQVYGDMENGDAYAGSSAGSIHEIVPAASVIENIIWELNGILRGLCES